MQYYELIPNPKDNSPKVMANFMHKAINDMHVSFDTHFGKKLSLADPSLGPKFLKEFLNHYDSNAMKHDMTLEKLQLLVTSFVEPHHKV
jgi:hypothetical protein